MTKLPMLSLSVLTTIAMAGAPAMTSHAATVRTYRIPVNMAGNFNNSNCNDLINSILGGNGNQNWNNPNCPVIPDFSWGGGQPIVPDYPNGGGQPIIPDDDQGGNETPSPDTSVDAYAAQVLKLVNEERAKVGAAPLTLNTSAQSAANVRAREIQRSFSHTRPNGSGFSTALTEAGVNFRASGENIAYGQRSPEAVMNGWMNSEGHRANILNKNFTSIGIGHSQNGGTDYWTQLFFN